MKLNIMKKIKFVGRPYKSESEREAYIQSRSEARISALKSKGRQDARRSVFGSKWNTSKKTFKKIKKHIPKVKAKSPYKPMKQEWGFESSQGFEPNIDNIMPIGWNKKKRR